LTAFRDSAVTADAGHPAPQRLDLTRKLSSNLSLSIYRDLNAIESEWRRFERIAECTAFQTFDWLATWQRHIGQREGVIPVIAVGTYADGETAFILPLAVEPKGTARRLCWLGQDLCDYAAPLLARDFAQRVSADRFRSIWQQLRKQMQRDPQLRHDWIDLEKMPHIIGAQTNPFTYLGVSANANGAHLTKLGDDWQSFYFEKRSSATRRHDRAKRRHLSKYGEIRFVNGGDPDDTRCMVETLMQQKSRSFARKGIPDIFARRGCREFFLDLAANPKTSNLIHISRVEIGTIWAAVNFGIVFGDCYYHVVASYEDGELSHYGPGALHLRELMAHAIGLGLRRFDFTIGDEPYKLEWSDTHLTLCDFIAAVTWRGWSVSFWSKAQRRLKRSIKQSPFAWRLVRNIRSKIGVLHTRPEPAPLPLDTVEIGRHPSDNTPE
jgi:CelD/BcsL family acetyltransferase involved in cellulose biosynthesis